MGYILVSSSKTKHQKKRKHKKSSRVEGDVKSIKRRAKRSLCFKLMPVIQEEVDETVPPPGYHAPAAMETEGTVVVMMSGLFAGVLIEDYFGFTQGGNCVDIGNRKNLLQVVLVEVKTNVIAGA